MNHRHKASAQIGDMLVTRYDIIKRFIVCSGIVVVTRARPYHAQTALKSIGK